MSSPARTRTLARSTPRWMRCALAMGASALVAATLVALPRAHAAESAASAAPREVRGVKLASICSACGVVSDVRAQTRDAPPDAKGAIAGAVVGGLAGHGVGNGNGRTAMTVLGAIGGDMAGNAIEKKMHRHCEPSPQCMKAATVLPSAPAQYVSEGRKPSTSR